MNTAVPAPDRGPDARRRWLPPVLVFLAVAAAQLWLVARAGTDVPFQDQWEVEGQGLYPAWIDGTLRPADLLRAHNEHRILWTRLLDLALFALNGQWDPLTQMVAGAGLRAGLAAALAWWLGRPFGARGRAWTAAGVTFAFLPQLAWHNALWGFQSQVYFVLLFSVLALALLGSPGPTRARQCGGLAAGLAALLAMGAGAFVPVALLGLAGLHARERRRAGRAFWDEAWPALVLLAAAWLLHAHEPAHVMLQATSPGQFFAVLGRLLAWPHVGQPLAALVLNLPLVLVVVGRLAGRQHARAGEDGALLLGGWAAAMALAAAWARGGSDEFAAGVPSRYVDFIVLLPLANAWCLAALIGAVAERRRLLARAAAAAWGVFLLVGWLGLSAEMLRGVIRPRLRDRDAPVRLMQAFQATGDAAVFAGQPRLLVPGPDVESVRAVLADPRMAGLLPPSLQPGRPLGPLSRAARGLLDQ